MNDKKNFIARLNRIKEQAIKKRENCNLSSKSDTPQVITVENNSLPDASVATVPDTPQMPVVKKSSPPALPSVIKKAPPNNTSKTDENEPLESKSLVIRGIEYTVYGQIGKGGFSKVYEGRCSGYGTVAIKVIKIPDDCHAREALRNEVKLLKKLQGREGVIKMYGYQQKGQTLYVVMEKGENDFQTFFRSSQKSPNMIRYYWEQMLRSVKDIHSENVVHSDLKPVNFVLVGGHLKLIDFGIAYSVPTDLTSVAINNQCGTVNYMSPEALCVREDDSKIHLNPASDVWSLGCILYTMVYDQPPFHSIRNQHMKICAITNDKHQIEFKPIKNKKLLEVMKLCLQRDPNRRPTVAQLLKHPYLNCDDL